MRKRQYPTHPHLCYPYHTMIRLELQPETEAQLAAQAQNQGLSTEQLVEQIILSQFPRIS
jgi:predicted HicB family RNase H-like nuclease